MFDGADEIVDPPKLEAGWTFASGSRYRLISPLGRGGMGEVWKAERRSAAGHVHTVAVKFISDTGSSSESLDAEALRMSQLSHDNIVPFLDSGLDDAGRYFVTMAFVEGLDLRGLMKLAGRDLEAPYDATAEICRIPDQIVGFVLFMTLRALEYAHNRDFGGGIVGLVHRDISPGNILLDEARGFVKLTDFGVALPQGAEHHSGQIAGKVPYMAPEVLLGDPADARSDLYGLGMVAYELLTGFNANVRPVMLHNAIGAITEVMLSLEEPLRSPHELVQGVDPRLSQIVCRMLERDPAARFQTAEEVLGEVSVHLYDRGYGPTTASLANYLKLLRDPAAEGTPRERQTLRFLDWRQGIEVVRPRWTLTPEAAAAVAAGRNPARS